MTRKDRDEIYIFTKGGFPRDSGDGSTYISRLKYTKDDIIHNIGDEEIVHSLSNLDSQITVYLMHRDDGDFFNYTRDNSRDQTPVKTILAALTDTKLSSHYKMIGISNWKTDRVVESQKQGDLFLRPVFNSPYFSLLEMKSDLTIHIGGVQVTHSDMMDKNFQPGVLIMPYSPLGGFSILSRGWENAKSVAYKLKNKISVEVWDWRYWQRVYDSIMHDDNKQRYDRAFSFLEKFNKEHQTYFSLDQLLNAYVLAHPRTDMLVVGPTSVSQLLRTVDSLSLSKNLSSSDLDYLYNLPKSDLIYWTWALLTLFVGVLVGFLCGAIAGLFITYFVIFSISKCVRKGKGEIPMYKTLNDENNNNNSIN